MLNYKKAPYLELKDYRAPDGVKSYFVPMDDGTNIRVCIWFEETNASSCQGTILLQQGHNEFVEKYYEVISEFLERGFAVIAFDWRGQGLSDRNIQETQRAYVKDFSFHDSDLNFILNKIIRPLLPQPLIGVGHSMGGCLMLSALRNNPKIFNSAILSSPMCGFRNERLLMTIISLSNIFFDNKSFLIGSKPNMGNETPFENNDLTTDSHRYKRTQKLVRKKPILRHWGITVAWANAVKKRLEQIKKENWVESIKERVLILNAVNDRVVDSTKTTILSKRLTNGKNLNFHNVEHEIFMEQDIHRKKVWECIDDFIETVG